MSSLDIDAITITVAAQALAQFRQEYPNRTPVWVNTVNDQLDIKIGSIHKENYDARLGRLFYQNRIKELRLRQHVWFHKTSSILDL